MELKKYAVNQPTFLSWVHLSRNGEVTKRCEKSFGNTSYELKIGNSYYVMEEAFSSSGYYNQYIITIPYWRDIDFDPLFALIKKYEDLYICSGVRLNVITDYNQVVLGGK